MAEKEKKWQVLAERITNRGAKRQYTLQQLKDEFISFVNYYVENPSSFVQRTKKKQKGADKSKAEYEFYGDRVDRVAPMTEYAFCLWIGKSKSWFPQTIADLKAMEHPSTEDVEYLEFLLQLQTFFSSQLLEGAILGEYTPSLVANLLGMKNQFDVTSGGDKVVAPVISIIEDTKTREEYDAKNQ